MQLKASCRKMAVGVPWSVGPKYMPSLKYGLEAGLRVSLNPFIIQNVGFLRIRIPSQVE